jgi:hypothetical protein
MAFACGFVLFRLVTAVASQCDRAQTDHYGNYYFVMEHGPSGDSQWPAVLRGKVPVEGDSTKEGTFTLFNAETGELILSMEGVP